MCFVSYLKWIGGPPDLLLLHHHTLKVTTKFRGNFIFYIQTWLLGNKPPVTEDLCEQDQAIPSFKCQCTELCSVEILLTPLPHCGHSVPSPISKTGHKLWNQEYVWEDRTMWQTETTLSKNWMRSEDHWPLGILTNVKYPNFNNSGVECYIW